MSNRNSILDLRQLEFLRANPSVQIREAKNRERVRENSKVDYRAPLKRNIEINAKAGYFGPRIEVQGFLDQNLED